MVNNNGLVGKYKLSEIAKEYGFKFSTLRKWAKEGKMDGIIRLGFGKTSPYYISKEDFGVFLETLKQTK
ncbi:MAG: hypothetical protein BWY74_00817 [Firmicutes bacterium ADurb.Bin419]|nr:MAG: hypothetical protein BWY74_00817 [Firmicutes bacterium ADurb.Bin419]